MSFYIYETHQEKHARTCGTCKRGMDQGYLFEETGETFCDALCASRGLRGSLKLVHEGRLFWTDWHDEVECAT